MDELMKKKVEEFRILKKKVELGGGPDKIEEQHRKGKLSARERIQRLLDPNTFSELDLFARHQCTDFGMTNREIPGDGVITGFGQIDGRQVAIYENKKEVRPWRKHGNMPV